MLHSTSLQFLKNLQKNNSKEWFDANRKQYEEAKKDFTQLTELVISGTSKFDASIAQLKPANCIFRINRDVRFSKDKSPYKTNMGMSIAKGGKSGGTAGYYFHFEPGGKSFVGGGLYMAMPEQVKKLRQEIDYCFDAFKKIINNKNFVSTYNHLQITKEFSLVRPPKGYEENNPAIEYLKLKSWIATTPVSDAELTDKHLAKKIIDAFKALHPLVSFINNGIDMSL